MPSMPKKTITELLCKQLHSIDKTTILETCARIWEIQSRSLNTTIWNWLPARPFSSTNWKKSPLPDRRRCKNLSADQKNYSTKMIARLSATSTRGIESIRYRLHKNSGCKNQSIKAYLCGFKNTSDKSIFKNQQKLWLPQNNSPYYFLYHVTTSITRERDMINE